MAERAKEQRVEEIRANGGRVYSISRLNTMNQCPYQAYLNYVLGLPQKNIGVYGCLGGKIHDVLENIIHNRAVVADIKTAMDEELDDLEMMGVDFPLDRNGDPTIRNNWIANITKFAENFKPFVGHFDTEQLVVLDLGNNNYLQGFIDLLRYNDDGTVSIFDWKTSSAFVGEHLVEAGRQLIAYKKALEQEGLRVRDCAWVMLKYYEATWMQKNGKPKSKNGEWRNLIKDLKLPIMRFLAESGMDEFDCEATYESALSLNDINDLPKEVAEKFDIHPYIRTYDIDEEKETECMQYIHDMISLFEQYGTDGRNFPHCDINKQSFFCNALCGYGGKSELCKYWQAFCDAFTGDDEDDEVFC